LHGRAARGACDQPLKTFYFVSGAQVRVMATFHLRMKRKVFRGAPMGIYSIPALCFEQVVFYSANQQFSIWICRGKSPPRSSQEKVIKMSLRGAPRQARYDSATRQSIVASNRFVSLPYTSQHPDRIALFPAYATRDAWASSTRSVRPAPSNGGVAPVTPPICFILRIPVASQVPIEK
jgi:hypothetical protein